MELKVDKNKCISCGQCVANCESVFSFDDDGQAKVIQSPIAKENIEIVTELMENICPTNAIEEV